MLLKIIFGACLLIFLQTDTHAQSVSGAWYGKADVVANGVFSNYLTELTLRQKGNEVEGVFAYYFKDSYQSFFVRGTFNKETRELKIKNLPMLLYASTARNGIECPMNLSGTLLVSKVQSTISGSFFSNEKYKYTCPELRVTFSLDATEGNPADLLRNMEVGKKFWKPQEEDYVVAEPASAKPRNGSAPLPTPNSTPKKEIPVVAAPVTIKETSTQALVAKFEKRKNVYSKDLEVIGDSLRITFYDNGDVDGDVISVFLDKNPILVGQPITDRGTNIYIKLDSLKEVSELSMFADNLGSIPPNTALMVVTDGVNRYELFLSSSLTQNATVRIKRKKLDPHRL